MEINTLTVIPRGNMFGSNHWFWYVSSLEDPETPTDPWCPSETDETSHAALNKIHETGRRSIVRSVRAPILRHRLLRCPMARGKKGSASFFLCG